MKTKKLPQQSLDTITCDSPANFATDSQSQPGRAAIFTQLSVYDEIPGMPPPPISTQSTVLIRAADFTAPGQAEAQSFHHLKKLLNGNRYHQALTPAGTATTNDRLTVFGLHTGTEAMGSFATNTTRLIGPFRHVRKLLNL